MNTARFAALFARAAARSPLRQALIAALLVALSAPAAADDPKKAQALFVEGNKFYNVGDYEKALERFKDGYFVKADPAFLFNLAQCYRMLGQPEPAIREYRAYLRGRPETPNRAEVEGFVAELEAEIKRRSEARPPQGTVPPAAPPPPESATPPGQAPAAAAPPSPQVQQQVPKAASPVQHPPTQETPPPAAAATTDSAAAPSPTPVYRKPWFWGVVGGGVVVAGGAVGLAVALTTPENAAVQSSALGPVAVPF